MSWFYEFYLYIKELRRKNAMLLKVLCFCFIFSLFIYLCFALQSAKNVPIGKMEEYFSWNQIKYDVYNDKYTKDTDYKKKHDPIIFMRDLKDSEKYFIQYNNVPVGLSVDETIPSLIITVPRRRYGIISTVNSVSGHRSQSPLLTPVPEPPRFEWLVSVYRPTIDRCRRLWMVDTGLLEVPDNRKQIQPPSIVIIDMDSNDGKFLLKYELKPTDLVNNRTSGGLTSITVEVGDSCDDAHAYINDLATETLIIFSLKDKDSWSFSHPSFKHDPSAVNFKVAGYIIPWRDGIFSTALGADTDRRKLYFHALTSTKEFSVYTDELKRKGNHDLNVMLEGDKGPNTQSGSHAYHAATNTLFFAGVAQDAILCWNVNKPLTPENVGVAAQDHKKLVYISDLRVVKDQVWVLVNQMPRFVYSALNPEEQNFFVHRGNVSELIKGTPCES